MGFSVLRLSSALALVLLASLVAGCGEERLAVDVDSMKLAFQSRQQELEDVDWRQEVEELYAQAKSAGEDVPDDISEWVAEDFNRIGAWEYAAHSLAGSDLEGVQRLLDHRGVERWECFHVVDRGDEIVLLFKRRMRSYLGSIPLRDLIRVISLTPSFGGES